VIVIRYVGVKTAENVSSDGVNVNVAEFVTCLAPATSSAIVEQIRAISHCPSYRMKYRKRCCGPYLYDESMLLPPGRHFFPGDGIASAAP
jgi:hypothetical protein